MKILIINNQHCTTPHLQLDVNTPYVRLARSKFTNKLMFNEILTSLQAAACCKTLAMEPRLRRCRKRSKETVYFKCTRLSGIVSPHLSSCFSHSWSKTCTPPFPISPSLPLSLPPSLLLPSPSKQLTWSGDSCCSIPTSTISKPSGATMAGFM